jgi:hypothetical protein
LTVAFGPIGVIGLVLLAWALLRRRPLLGLVAAAALTADATAPALGGLASTRATRPHRSA